MRKDDAKSLVTKSWLQSQVNRSTRIVDFVMQTTPS